MSLSSNINSLTVAIRDKLNLMSPRLIPTGGVVGQLVTKTSSAPDTYGWATPSGGGSGETVILDGNGPVGTPVSLILDGNG